MSLKIECTRGATRGREAPLERGIIYVQPSYHYTTTLRLDMDVLRLDFDAIRALRPEYFYQPYRSHPFYSWGKNRVIFEEWSSLKDALRLFRNSPESHPEFGDWSPGIDGLDQFRDGQASVRMGKYIGEIYKAIVGGATKEQALATAADWYTQSVEVGPFGHKCHR